ncbi:CarboxypepD_reg-like domain-containing protein [Hymenobacter daecheongensis DSM 21074]|uniref:CarboxypepD_reg-like domain-containing protein n=1 Tax=Hymenobacter daecheongensis DSM 21074 TaxID=1121955 RepID=A0A1M6AYK2_9BACT|nr:carboxypeptidase-like regulatory domain-containing protein [Hymenobacter daecheongensis]SHI41532.1 CarboxypepD_reg-like domain-containing protein [Hymenobacter daecheongensis DSM 21074]
MHISSLQIPSPCAESWEAMTPQGAGRHCASCQQVVIDFTQKTDAEILAILGATAAAGHVCGRLRSTQLNRPLRGLATGSRASGWRTMLAATAALLGLRELVAPAAARAQSYKVHQPNFGRHSFQHPLSAPRPAAATAATVEAAPADTAFHSQLSGQVTDEKGQPLPGVTVLLQGTQNGISSDADGRFTLTVARAERAIPIGFHSIGYVTSFIPQPADGQPLRVVLREDMRDLGGVIVVGGPAYGPIYTPRGIWSRLRSIPYRIGGLFR